MVSPNKQHAYDDMLRALRVAKERLEMNNCEGSEKKFIKQIDVAIERGEAHALNA